PETWTTSPVSSVRCVRSSPETTVCSAASKNRRQTVRPTTEWQATTMGCP
ncbi:uncharacterized protein METZ01_LOCUS489154, partial [marine metagenome]